MRIFECTPLNWFVVKKYAAISEGEDNPDLYYINIGSMSDMWSASILLEDMILNFTSVHYSNHEVYSFKVESLEEASEMVKKFAIGMGRWGDMENTVFVKKV